MAAHILSGIKEIMPLLVTDAAKAKAVLIPAVEYDCWSSDDPSEWSTEDGGLWNHLHKFVKDEYTPMMLYAYLQYCEIRFAQLWERLGQPPTREVWLERFHNSFLKGDKQ